MPGNLNYVPPSVIATWPEPNLINPVERTWMPVFAGTLQALSTLTVGTRLVLRLRNQAGALGWDDAFLILGFLFGTMFTGLCISSATRWGSDKHIWDVDPAEFPTTVLIAWLAELSFMLSTCSTKVSVLLFYRRLVDGNFSRKWKWAIIVAIICTALFCGIIVGFIVFTCAPTDAYWMAFAPDYEVKYTCLNTKPLNPISGALSVVSDLYAVVLPVAMMRHFETNRTKKIALNAIFSLGLLVVMAGIVRTYYLTQLGTGYDLTWIGFNVFVWSDLEAQLALIVASAPALRVLFRQYVGQPFSRAARSRQSNGGTVDCCDEQQHIGSPPESPTCMRTHGVSTYDTDDCKNQQQLGHDVKFSLASVEEHGVCSRGSSMSGNIDHSYVMQNLETRTPP